MCPEPRFQTKLERIVSCTTTGREPAVCANSCVHSSGASPSTEEPCQCCQCYFRPYDHLCFLILEILFSNAIRWTIRLGPTKCLHNGYNN